MITLNAYGWDEQIMNTSLYVYIPTPWEAPSWPGQSLLPSQAEMDLNWTGTKLTNLEAHVGPLLYSYQVYISSMTVTSQNDIMIVCFLI